VPEERQPDDLEAVLNTACREAHLSWVETEAILLRADGYSYAFIRNKLQPYLHHTQRRDIKFWLDALTKRIAPHLEDFWEPGRRWPEWLDLCVRNSRVADERDPTRSGVTPAHELQRYTPARMVAADDRRLQQSASECLVHYANEERYRLREAQVAAVA
jgi:hypothetical protein